MTYIILTFRREEGIMNLVFRTSFKSRIEFEVVLIISDTFSNSKSSLILKVFDKTKISQMNMNEIFFMKS